MHSYKTSQTHLEIEAKNKAILTNLRSATETLNNYFSPILVYLNLNTFDIEIYIKNIN